MIRCGWVLTDLAGGGAERIPLLLGPAFHETELEVVLLKDRIEHEVEATGPPVVALSSGERSLTRAWAPILTRAVRKARSLDVLVAGLEWAPTFFAVACGSLARRPVVATVHTDLRRYAELEPVPAGWWRAMRWCLRRSAAVVAVSEDVRDCLLDLGVDAARLRVIPNPVKAFRHPPRTDNKRPRLLTISSLKHIKGVDLIPRVAAHLGDVDFEWTVVGDGPQRESLRRSTEELGVADRVRFAGFQRDVGPFLGAADLYVLPSRTEGFPLVLGEAMSAGLPVVATRCARAVEDELADDVGDLVPIDDVQAMADAVRRLLADPARRDRLGRAGRERARAFDPQAIAPQYEDLLAAVVDEHAAGRSGPRNN